MMEVNHHNTPLEFNDMVTSTTAVGNNDGRLRSPLSNVDRDHVVNNVELLSNLKSASILKDEAPETNDVITNGCITAGTIVNGSDIIRPSLVTPTIDLDDVGLDGTSDVCITPELEDELLADEDDTNAKVVHKLLAEIAPVTPLDGTAKLNTPKKEEEEEDILRTSQQSTSTSADVLRDPGDDLDKLLSKINDIVEDCVDSTATKDTETLPVVTKRMDELSTKKIIDDESEKDVNNIVVLDDSATEENLDASADDLNNSGVSVDTEEISKAEILKTRSSELKVEKVSGTPNKNDTAPKEPLALSDLTEDMVEILSVEDEKTGEKVAKNSHREGQNTKEENKSDSGEVIVINEEDILLDAKSDETGKGQLEKVKKVGNTVPSEKTDVSVKAHALEKVGSSEKANTCKKADASEKADASKKEDVSEPADAFVTTERELESSSPRQKDVEKNNEAIIKSKKNKTELSEENKISTLPASISVDVDDSDDEIVFLLDDTNEKTNNLPNENNIEKEKIERPAEVAKAASVAEEDDDDVVLLDDDDDVEMVSKTEDSPTSEAKGAETKDGDSKSSVDMNKLKLHGDGVDKGQEEQEEKEKSDLKSTSHSKCDNETEKKILTKSENVETVEPKVTVANENVNEVKRVAEDGKEKIDSQTSIKNRSDPDISDVISENASTLDHISKVQDDKEEQILNTESEASTKPADLEETNSNCSSSSNLLQESQVVASEVGEGGEEETDIGNDDEEDGLDNDCEVVTEVEIVEAEVEDEDLIKGANNEEKDLPPAKRIRLSVDEEDKKKFESSDENKVEVRSSGDDEETKSSAAKESEPMNTEQTKIDVEKTASKRSFDRSLSEDADKSIEKKPKIENSILKVEEDQKKGSKLSEQSETKPAVTEIKDNKEDKDKEEKIKASIMTLAESEKTDVVQSASIKAFPSHTPVPLYPPPNLEAITPQLSLDFLRRFKKSLEKMTKLDLEELVLQKIVEVVIHKSEFGEMRELIEKQETFISAQRTKLTELAKQFRDLEMVHNRVLRDIETKNSQFLMPVKITRAVGLQVFIPPKKNSDPVANAAANTITSPCGPQQASSSVYRSSGNPNVSPHLSSPQRQSSQYEASIAASSTSVVNSRPPTSILPPSSSAPIINSRRGCVQKVTPQRPIDSGSNTPITPLAGIYRNIHPQPPPISPQIPAKLLNKSASAATQPRPRFPGSSAGTVMQQQQHQQQILRQQPSPTNPVRKVTPGPSTPVVSKTPPSSIIGQQYRRPEPPPAPQSSLSVGPVADSYMGSMHPLQQPGLPAVSITPAKPKDKSVIDLTDEDEAPSSAATTPASIRQRVSNSPNVGGAVGSTNYILNKLSNSARLAGATSNANAKGSASRQLSGLYGSRTNGNSPIPTNISTPPGTSITRVTPNAGVQRVKYGHPAPLPPTPTQNLHPAWKLPPPRPTIRISNLENGIVISWTVEEPMERHAECVSYQIYAYQETSGPPLIDSWRHVGDVKAMLLPMAVTLTQFQEGQRYFFAVRAVDIHHRVGPFSVPKTWS